MAKSFGIDEMTALAGGSHLLEESAAFRPSTGVPSFSSSTTKKKVNDKDADLSTLSAAETAAMLLEKNSTTKVVAATSTGRHRTNKVLAHHTLVQELSSLPQAQEQNHLTKKQSLSTSRDEGQSDSDDDFGRQKRLTRKRTIPQIIKQKDDGGTSQGIVSSKRPRRRNDSSSSSSSDSSSDESERKHPSRGLERRKRRSSGSSSSSNDDDDDDDDDEEDRRRQRLRANRQRQEPQIIKTVAAAVPPTMEDPKVTTSQMSDLPASTNIPTSANESAAPPKHGHAIQRKQKKDSSSEDESSSDGSSTGEESSSTDSTSSSDEEEALAKPVFVPKNKRNLLQSEERKWEEEELRIEREKQRTEKRKMESRAMVAKTVAVVQTTTVDDDVDEEGGGATNSPPNDNDDDIDKEQQRDAWEVRELARLLSTMDEMMQREKEMLEYQRRREMTDEEVLEYDKKVGRYQAPGSNRQPGTTGKFLQRFYHRGAFYMAEDEWEENDIRHKAAEYAKAATGEDKIDKSILPEVMQVKGFGFARQNTRYKGLAKEDTTDKNQDILPLVLDKKR